MKFIRKNGKVIPIRDGGRKKSNSTVKIAAAGAQMVAQGAVIGAVVDGVHRVKSFNSLTGISKTRYGFDMAAAKLGAKRGAALGGIVFGAMLGVGATALGLTVLSRKLKKMSKRK